MGVWSGREWGVGLAAACCAFFVFSAQSVSAQVSVGKRYEYESIVATIRVSTNTTLTVEERQTFRYEGSFNAATREIPLRNISAITDIQVVEGDMGQPLAYSPTRLDKVAPTSWNQFTSWTDGGVHYIEWYYDLANTSHEWIIRYTVHGGLEFLDTIDRLYWNVFSAYSVPVRNVAVNVYLPEGIPEASIQVAAYRGSGTYDGVISKSASGAVFAASAFSPDEAFTIDVGWPKGVIDRSAFWWDWAGLYWGYLLAAFSIVLAILFGFLYWYHTEKSREAGSIVPQYEPPEALRPAIAEVIAKERITNKGMAATLIDLAVRGYVRIEEDRAPWGIFAVVAWVFLLFVAANFFINVVIGAAMRGIGWPSAFAALIGAAYASLYLYRALYTKKRYRAGGFILYKTDKAYQDDDTLLDYEKQYLNVLLGSGEPFSTRAVRKDPKRAQALHKRVLKIMEEILKQAAVDPTVYERSPTREKKKDVILVVTALCLGAGLVFYSQSNLTGGIAQAAVFLATLLASGICLWAFVRYEARLSDRGIALKKDWLGFKMYLEVAEKYRMQNLTPDLFEKFLPYAMIFGVEKQWARAFEGMRLAPPAWYRGAVPTSGAAGSAPSTASFSPTAFSASFTSAFSTAFSSSGGGGGGVGGGGAGGGGGGGGGGAS